MSEKHVTIPIKTVTRRMPHQSSCGANGSGHQSGHGPLASPKNALPPSLWARIKDHPCYSEAAHHHFARMHVAVAPACNIQCHYCNHKYDCSNESRPGVVSEKLTPDQAVRKVLAVAARIPQLSVVGIAGPGDALASASKTFRTIELIQKSAPDLKLCLSTNGLLLPDYVATIKDLNIDYVTITINMIDPNVGTRIYPWIFYRNRRWTGIDAATILSERQLEGLEALTAAGVLVKINSVLIPGINDHHLRAVNQAVKSRGAFLHNIMPLISDPSHGTHYGLNGQRGPTPSELKELQDTCEGGVRLLRHCRQCRADAVGLLGHDQFATFTTDQLEEVPDYNPQPQRIYREFVENEQTDRQMACEQALKRLSGVWPHHKIQIAVATKGGGRINESLDHANEFHLYEVSVTGAKFIGHRRIKRDGVAIGEQQAVNPLSILTAIQDCSAVLVTNANQYADYDLEKTGIEIVSNYAYEYIDASALRYLERCITRLRMQATA